MFGVIVFVLVLLTYGFILSRKLILNMFKKPDDETQSAFVHWMINLDNFFNNKGAQFIFAVAALIIGIWNLFSPDFVHIYSLPILGALIPSVLLILDAAVIDEEIVEWLNLPQESKTKYYEFMDKIKDYMGVMTLVAGILHIAFFRSILL